jgi:hypothetical protein
MMPDGNLKLSIGLSLQKQLSTGRRLYSPSNCTSSKCFIYQLMNKRNVSEEILKFTLTLSNPIFLPTAYSSALICFGR